MKKIDATSTPRRFAEGSIARKLSPTLGGVPTPNRRVSKLPRLSASQDKDDTQKILQDILEMTTQTKDEIKSLREDSASKIKQVVDVVNDHSESLNGLETEMARLKNLNLEISINQLKVNQNLMQAEIEAMKLNQSKSASSSGEGQKRLPAWAQVPISERKTYILGGLGYNEPQDDLLQRAREVLALVNCPELHDLKCPFKYGSSAEMTFKKVEDIQDISNRVAALKKTYGQSQNAVWCAVRKTKEEREPGRRLTAVFKALEEHQKTRGGPAPELCRLSRKMYVNRVEVARVTKTGIVFTEGVKDSKFKDDEIMRNELQDAFDASEL